LTADESKLAGEYFRYDLGRLFQQADEDASSAAPAPAPATPPAAPPLGREELAAIVRDQLRGQLDELASAARGRADAEAASLQALQSWLGGELDALRRSAAPPPSPGPDPAELRRAMKEEVADLIRQELAGFLGRVREDFDELATAVRGRRDADAAALEALRAWLGRELEALRRAAPPPGPTPAELRQVVGDELAARCAVLRDELFAAQQLQNHSKGATPPSTPGASEPVNFQVLHEWLKEQLRAIGADPASASRLMDNNRLLTDDLRERVGRDPRFAALPDRIIFLEIATVVRESLAAPLVPSSSPSPPGWKEDSGTGSTGHDVADSTPTLRRPGLTDPMTPRQAADFPDLVRKYAPLWANWKDKEPRPFDYFALSRFGGRMTSEIAVLFQLSSDDIEDIDARLNKLCERMQRGTPPVVHEQPVSPAER
jgi:hypothetical protein